MIQILINLPAWLVILAGGAVVGAAFAPGAGRTRIVAILGALAGGAVGLLVGWRMGWLDQEIPVRWYGTMIVAGVLLGIVLARRRAPLLGIDPNACIDVGMLGAIGGVIGARLFHVVQFWEHYNFLGPRGFEAFLDIFRVWQGGLVFYGAFAAVIPLATWYCWRNKIPMLPFLDVAAPCLIAGLAIGRLGCFTRGCCYGKECAAPWALQFPPGSDAYQAYMGEETLLAMPAVHPTQLYAAMGAALAAAFLYTYWPRRRFDGEVLGLMLILAGVTRFFEELLRKDVPAGIPALSHWVTIAQWVGMLVIFLGAACFMYFSQRRTLYVPAPATRSTEQ